MSRIIDLIATLAAAGITGYFLYKVVLPGLKDIQLPTFQFPQFPQPQQQQPQQQPSDQLPAPEPTQEQKEPTQEQKEPTPQQEDEEDSQIPSKPQTQAPSPPSNIQAPPLPTGTGIIWSSSTWSNGKPRSISGHQEKDPSDPRVWIAAGEGRNATFDGKGTCFLSGARARLYIDAHNYNSQMMLTYVHNATLDNLSLRLRSHRDESGGFGGYKLVISRDRVEAAWQTAYQGQNPKLGEQQLPQALPANQPVTVKWYVRDVGARIEIGAAINYGSGFKTVITAYEDKPPAVARNKTAFLQSSIAWIRTNGGAPKNIPLKNVSITNLG